jgi:hypothetical protein
VKEETPEQEARLFEELLQEEALWGGARPPRRIVPFTAPIQRLHEQRKAWLSQGTVWGMLQKGPWGGMCDASREHPSSGKSAKAWTVHGRCKLCCCSTSVCCEP